MEILKADTIKQAVGASGSVIVSKLDLQTYTSEFESHWVPHSYGLVPHLSKKLSKLSPSKKRRRRKLFFQDHRRLRRLFEIKLGRKDLIKGIKKQGSSCNILRTILEMNKGRNQTNETKNKKIDDYAPGFTAERKRTRQY